MTEKRIVANRWAERNTQVLHRLATGRAPAVPPAVLIHARGQRFAPHLPRLAVESYWRAHPLRADRLSRALSRRSAVPDGWIWRVDARTSSFRTPPAPFREAAHDRGPGVCCICGQPIFRLGWHTDLGGTGEPNRRARWHACCVAAWKLWTEPNQHWRLLSRLQNKRCADTASRLLRGAEVDHRIPLFKVWRHHREEPWADLLDFWGLPNLQMLNKGAHLAKTSQEAGDRAYPSARVESPDWRFSGRGMPTMLNPAST